MTEHTEAYNEMVDFITNSKTRPTFMKVADYVQEGLYRWGDEKEYEDKNFYIKNFQKAMDDFIKLPSVASWKACSALGTFKGFSKSKELVVTLKITKSKIAVQ